MLKTILRVLKQMELSTDFSLVPREIQTSPNLKGSVITNIVKSTVRALELIPTDQNDVALKRVLRDQS